MNNDLPPAIHFHFDVDEKLTIYFAWPYGHIDPSYIFYHQWASCHHV